jgi:hypothetical protein
VPYSIYDLYLSHGHKPGTGRGGGFADQEAFWQRNGISHTILCTTGQDHVAPTPSPSAMEACSGALYVMQRPRQDSAPCVVIARRVVEGHWLGSPAHPGLVSFAEPAVTRVRSTHPKSLLVLGTCSGRARYRSLRLKGLLTARWPKMMRPWTIGEDI